MTTIDLVGLAQELKVLQAMIRLGHPFNKVADAVAQMTGRMDEFRANVAKIRKRAAFEIPLILARVPDAGSAQTSMRSPVSRLLPAGRPIPPTPAAVPTRAGDAVFELPRHAPSAAASGSPDPRARADASAA